MLFIKPGQMFFLIFVLLKKIDFDDYTGKFCDEGPFPLANAIKSVFEEFSAINLNSSEEKSDENGTNSTLLISTTTNSYQASKNSSSSATSLVTKKFSSKLGVLVGGVNSVLNDFKNGMSLTYNSGQNSTLDLNTETTTFLFTNNTNNFTIESDKDLDVPNNIINDDNNSAFRSFNSVLNSLCFLTLNLVFLFFGLNI